MQFPYVRVEEGNTAGGPVEIGRIAAGIGIADLQSAFQLDLTLALGTTQLPGQGGLLAVDQYVTAQPRILRWTFALGKGLQDAFVESAVDAFLLQGAIGIVDIGVIEPKRPVIASPRVPADGVLSFGRLLIAAFLFGTSRTLAELNPVSLDHLIAGPKFQSPLVFDHQDACLIEPAIGAHGKMQFLDQGAQRLVGTEEMRLVMRIINSPGSDPIGHMPFLRRRSGTQRKRQPQEDRR